MTDLDTRLGELTVGELVARLASSAPVPGGGSASAIVGALAAALVHMVVELSVGRPAHASDEAALREIGLAASGWQSELMDLASRDAAAYGAVVAARRMPRDTDLDRQARRVQIAAATRDATRVPLRIAEAASAVLDLAARVAQIGNPNVASDAGVAARLAAAAGHGAALNVRINLPELAEDDELRREAAERIDTLVSGLAERESTVTRAIEDRIG